MIRFIQRQKSRKGFTIIELIVVIAIIAILTAVILPALSSERSRKNEAKSAATDFYAAVQMVMSKFSLYDGNLSIAYTNDKNLGIMRHYPMMGGNYPYDKDAGITDHEYPAATSLYIMVEAKNGNIRTIGTVARAQSRSSTNPGFFDLLKRNASDRNTEFGRLFTGEVEDWISFQDGFYYARVDFVPPLNSDKTVNKDEINSETVKVAWAAYTRKELPAPKSTDSVAKFTTDNLYFGSDFKLTCGEVCGTCAHYEADWEAVGDAGTHLD